MVTGLWRHALGIGLAVAILAGCGGSQTSAVPQNAITQARAPQASRTRGDLLYVVCCSPSASEITILKYPQGKIVGTIEGVEDPYGMCADSSGNVWVVNVSQVAYEYAHGGTTPISSVQVPNSFLATDCAVDPLTGDLAIISYDGPSGPAIDVWQNAQGNPTVYPIGFVPWSCTFDDEGNLFVDGFLSGSEQDFQFAELARGSSSFENITLNTKTTGWAGAVRWDGRYVAVAITVPQFQTRVYRVEVSGSSGFVVRTLDFKRIEQVPDFWIQGGTIVAGAGHYGQKIAVWHYEKNGFSYERIPGLYGRYVAISVAPSDSRIHK